MLAVTIVLAHWLDTMVSPHAAFRSLAVAIAGATVLTALLTAVTGGMARGGIIVSSLIGILYSKHVVEFVNDLGAAMPTSVLVVWIAALVALAVLGLRLMVGGARSWKAARANVVLNVVGLAYLVTTVAMGLASGKFAYALADLDQGVSLDEAARSASLSPAPAGGRDIYLILVDGYPRADVLEEAFGFDNGTFLGALEQRGFSVASSSRSDYLWTQQSLTSMLHMAYVEDIPRFRGVLEGRLPQDPTLREIVNDNPTFDLAREHGYEVVATGYEFDQVSLRQADVYVERAQMNEFELNLLVSTFLSDVLAVVTPDLASGQHREGIETQFDSLVEIAEAPTDGPRIVFGHISAPHQPTVFGAQGEPIVVPISRSFYADSPQERHEPADEFATKYRNQLAYLNRRALETVDGIVAHSAEPPVIVLWADHGSASRVDWLETSPEEADPDVLLERTAILFAALTPSTSHVFPDDVSPASIVRFLADAYFGTDYGRAVRSTESGGTPPLDPSGSGG